MKVAIYAGLIIGSLIGGMIPMLWGNYDYISPTYGFFSCIGGGLGVIVSIRIAEFLGEEDDEK